VDRQISYVLDQTLTPVVNVAEEHRQQLQKFIWRKVKTGDAFGQISIPWQNVRMVERKLNQMGLQLPYWFFEHYQSVLPDTVIPDMSETDPNKTLDQAKQEEDKLVAEQFKFTATSGSSESKTIPENPFETFKKSLSLHSDTEAALTEHETKRKRQNKALDEKQEDDKLYG
jgi:hypothetical protein